MAAIASMVECLAARRSSMSDLKGKVAVVTGASKGIGAAIAKGLSAAGAAVVVNYSSSKEGADRVVAEHQRPRRQGHCRQGAVTTLPV
jgi:NAD(P)-dependent dehydrogenase (short-subunit alcohol dehydrogenase family)